MPVIEIGKGVGQLTPPKPVPKHRNFSNFIDAYLDYTKNHEASRKFHKWTCISTIAGALGRHVYIPRGHYRIYPNLYVLLVGPAGLVKKSTTSGIGMDLLRGIDDIRIMADQVTQAALIDTLKGSYQKFGWPGSPEPHAQSSVFVYASEFKVLMDEVYGSITELLTTFFDCTPYDFTHPWTRETKGEGQVKVFGPCINLLGCSTTSWLRKSIPIDQLEGGFASRILYVVDNSLPEKFVAIPEEDPNYEITRAKLISDLRYMHNLAGKVSMEPAVAAIFKDWYEKFMTEVGMRGANDKFSGYWGRRSTMVEKLAIILSINEDDSLIIREKHIYHAITLAEELANGMFEAFRSVGNNTLAEALYNIYDVIRANGAVTQDMLFRKAFGYCDFETLTKVLHNLQQMGAIQQKNRGGRFHIEAVRPDLGLAELAECDGAGTQPQKTFRARGPKPALSVPSGPSEPRVFGPSESESELPSPPTLEPQLQTPAQTQS